MTPPQLRHLQERTDQMMWEAADACQQHAYALAAGTPEPGLQASVPEVKGGASLAARVKQEDHQPQPSTSGLQFEICKVHLVIKGTHELVQIVECLPQPAAP